MELSVHNWANISQTICPQNAHFWQVDFLDVDLSEYLDESLNSEINFYDIITLVLCYWRKFTRSET